MDSCLIGVVRDGLSNQMFLPPVCPPAHAPAGFFVPGVSKPHSPTHSLPRGREAAESRKFDNSSLSFQVRASQYRSRVDDSTQRILLPEGRRVYPDILCVHLNPLSVHVIYGRRGMARVAKAKPRHRLLR